MEGLRECADGTFTTTGTLAHDYGYDDMKTFELFKLHKALFRAALANNITLRTFKDDGKMVGLPFNLTFVVRNKGAQIKCPHCRSNDTARYIYGYPALSEEMQRKLDQGKWVLGECCTSSVEINDGQVTTMPSRHCNKCKKDFGTAPILLTSKRDRAEDYRDIVTSIKFSVGGYFQGHTEVTITKNYRGAIVKVKKFPPILEISKKQITPAKWRTIVNTLYGRLFLHEWKKEFVNPNVLDGTQWHLDINLTNGKTHHYYGSNDYPPYWSELTNIFKAYTV